MASKTSKWMTVITSAAISMMVGGGAFAAPASAVEGTGTTMGLLPAPISEAAAAARTAVAEGQRQVRQHTNSLRSSDGDSDVISDVNGLRTNIAEVQRQVRQLNDSLRSADAGSSTTMGLLPDPISKALAAGRTAVAEGQRQVRQHTNSLRSSDGDSDVISDVNGLRTKVAEAQRQARQLTNSLRSADGDSNPISEVHGLRTNVAEADRQFRHLQNQTS